MVLEMPCPDEHFLFVASSLPDRRRAEREIVLWARSHGYYPRPNRQTFVTYQAGEAAQEWRLLERRAHQYLD